MIYEVKDMKGKISNQKMPLKSYLELNFDAFQERKNDKVLD